MGVTKVEFYRNATLIASDTTSPYQYSFTPTWEDNGNYIYTAKAYDAKGNVKTSSPVNISINIPVQNPIEETIAINGPTRVIANTQTHYYTSSNFAPTLVWDWQDQDTTTEGFSVAKAWRRPTSTGYAYAEYGEPGDPVSVSGVLSGIYVIGQPLAAGHSHNCALTPSGQIKCWGNNYYGALGNNSTNTKAEAPVDVSGISGAKSVGAGDEHSCALKSDNTVACWGKNENGEVGNNSTTKTLVPVNVSGLSNIKALAVGRKHNCVITSDDKIKCWGDNVYHQLGNPAVSSSADALVPVEVTDFTDAVAVAAGLYNTCAIKRGGSVWCWGHAYLGQLGNGVPNLVDSATPVQVTGIAHAVSIAVGDRFACATTADAKAWCWGRNQYGQLGNGSTENAYSPVEVQGLLATSIAAGTDHTCATSASGLYCWGSGGVGGLGIGSVGNASTPQLVASLDATRQAVYVAAGDLQTCALLNDGTIKCWGYDVLGQLGDGANNVINSLVPVTVSGGAVFWK